MGVKSTWIRVQQTVKNSGWLALFDRVKARLLRQPDPIRDDYPRWIKKYSELSASERVAMREQIGSFRFQPRISILMPVFNTDERWLRSAIQSVKMQIYPYWELCIADDCSSEPQVRKVLEEFSESDPRIKVSYRQSNGHISAASNSALRLASGEFTALLDHDDELSQDALFWIVNEINLHPDVDLIYTDEDKIDLLGRRHHPHFKPDWDPILFCSLNLVTHLACYRTQVIRNVNGFRVGFEGSQDYDLALRISEVTPPQRIRHIPRILYHWREVPGSTALLPSEKDYATTAAAAAISEHLQRRNLEASVLPAGHGGYHRVSFPISDRVPIVSIILCVPEVTESVRQQVERIRVLTDYTTTEWIVVSSKPSGQLSDRFAILLFRGPFEELAMRNFAARNSRGEILVFLSPSVTPVNGEWLKELVSFAARPDAGSVGARLLASEGRIYQAGLTLGIDGIAGCTDRLMPKEQVSYLSKVHLIHGTSVVSGECLAIRKKVFEEINGFDETLSDTICGDVDLCLSVRTRGYSNLYTPYAELIQNQIQNPVALPANLERLKMKWGETIHSDPFYNPNLSLSSKEPGLAFPPRIDSTFDSRQQNDIFPGKVFSGIRMPLQQS